MRNYNKINKGFTLVELAIVIVIIGLLVGGVLQGKELIEQAKIRSQIKQFEEFNAATLLYKEKFKYIPGDAPSAARSAFGITGSADAASAANGIIDDYLGNSPTQCAWHESRFFFITYIKNNILKNI